MPSRRINEPNRNAGIGTGYTVLDGSHNAENQNTEQDKKQKQKKNNTPNNKQNTQNAKPALWTGPAQSEKSDVLCIIAESSVWREINNQKHSKETKTSPYRKTCEGSNKTLSGNQGSPSQEPRNHPG